jgi:hypothetical protein
MLEVVAEQLALLAVLEVLVAQVAVEMELFMILAEQLLELLIWVQVEAVDKMA